MGFVLLLSDLKHKVFRARLCGNTSENFLRFWGWVRLHCVCVRLCMVCQWTLASTFSLLRGAYYRCASQIPLGPGRFQFWGMYRKWNCWSISWFCFYCFFLSCFAKLPYGFPRKLYIPSNSAQEVQFFPCKHIFLSAYLWAIERYLKHYLLFKSYWQQKPGKSFLCRIYKFSDTVFSCFLLNHSWPPFQFSSMLVSHFVLQPLFSTLYLASLRFHG